MGYLWDPVAGRPRDQIMGRSRNVCRTSAKQIFYVQISNISNLLQQVSQNLIVSRSSENFSQKCSR